MGYWIGGFVIVMIVFFCIRNIVKDLRRGKCVGCSFGSCPKCSGSCASCNGACGAAKQPAEALDEEGKKAVQVLKE